MFARRAFTLLEVLVAIILVAAGLLSTVAAMGTVLREADAGRTRAAAATVAMNRIEQLRAGPCAGAAGSATAARGIRENWSATILDSRVREIRDSVTFPLAGLDHAMAIVSRAPC